MNFGLLIAECGFPGRPAGLIPNPKSEIRNPKFLKDGRPAPAHTKLGAKWVEVRKRRVPAEGDSKMKANLKRPATTVKGSLEINGSFTLRT
jgi:hypothetical protein